MQENFGLIFRTLPLAAGIAVTEEDESSWAAAAGSWLYGASLQWAQLAPMQLPEGKLTTLQAALLWRCIDVLMWGRDGMMNRFSLGKMLGDGGVLYAGGGSRRVKKAQCGKLPCVSKQCPADGVWRIGRGGSPDRVLKTRFTPLRELRWTRFATPSESKPKQCPANGVRRAL